MGLIRVFVDDTSVEVREGSTALEAIRAAGLNVPTACHDERLKPSGACRLCLVKVDSGAKPVASCSLEARDGMKISVSEPDLVQYRKGLLAMLAQNYPREYVDAYPEKTFHHWLVEYGLKEKCQGETGNGAVDRSNPYFRFDPNACIECYRCVRVCSELQGSFVWQIVDRGTGVRVSPDSFGSLADSTCRSCGACADACPTGALVDKEREAKGAAKSWTRTTCPYCGVGCELSVGTKDGRIVQVLPVKDAPVNKGHLCVKGRYAHAYVHAPDRATSPMIRRDGKLVPVSWEEAVKTVAAEFQRLLDAHGPGSVGVLGSARAPNEDNYIAQKFARTVLGTNNVDCCARVCHGPTAAAMKTVLGTGAATNSYNDIERAQTLLVIGCNPSENHPVVGERIKQAKFNGANLIVVDPRKIEMADYADVHVALRPGTNVAFLNAMACAVFEQGLEDAAFLFGRTWNHAEFREFVAPWTPERASEVCGVPAGTIREAARLYATSKPSMAFHGLGMTEHMQGTEGVMCLVNLALITGNIGKLGSGINPLRGQNNVQGSAHMGCEPSSLTGYVAIQDGFDVHTQVWGQVPPTAKGLNLMDMMDAAAEGTFKGLWTIGYDIYFTNADAEKTRQSMENLEFLVVQDLFVNETAREFADVFLPACSSFERDGTFMNAERRVQLVRQAVPHLPGTKPDWEIVQDVAAAMGHPEGFEFSSAEEIWEEVRKVWKAGAGMSYARLESGGLQWPCPSEDHPGTTILHVDRFPVGEKANLALTEYIPTPEITTQEFPMVMNSGRSLYHFNAGTMTARTKNAEIRPTDTVDVHPDDAADLGFSQGEVVRIVSRYGSAELPVRIDRGLRRGEVFTTFHSVSRFLNKVTGPTRDRIVGSPEYKVTAVRLEKV